MRRAASGYRTHVGPRSFTDAPVRVRFAPSPTGSLHLGSAFVAVANAAFARAHGGALLLRIDDTDAARSSSEVAIELPFLVRWLGIMWDELVHQVDRSDAHVAALERLVVEGSAYRCFCDVERLRQVREAQVAAGAPPRYDGACRDLTDDVVQELVRADRPSVVRLRVDASCDVVVRDVIHGEVTIPAGSFGDPALSRSDGSVGYLLASVVDDVDYAITHVIRGEDHLPNAARQQLLFEALHAPVPTWAHLPLLRDVDGSKLSKRAPLGTLDELVAEGYLPVSIRRYLAELAGQGAVDLLAREHAGFDLERVSAGAPRVDRDRLDSIGREDMAALDLELLLGERPVTVADDMRGLLRELAATSPTRGVLRRELRAVLDGPTDGVDPDTLHVLELAAAQLEAVETADPGWADGFLQAYREHGRAHGLAVRDLLQPLRRALTGSAHGPALAVVLAALGRDEALRRVRAGGNEGVVG